MILIWVIFFFLTGPQTCPCLCVFFFSGKHHNFWFEGIFNAYVLQWRGSVLDLLVVHRIPTWLYLSFILIFDSGGCTMISLLSGKLTHCLLLLVFSLLLQFFPPLFFSSLLDVSITVIPNFAWIVFHSVTVCIQWMSICIVAVLSSSLICVPCFSVVLLVFLLLTWNICNS